MNNFVGDAVSQNYDHWRPLISNAIVEKMQQFLQEKISPESSYFVVDAGCGTGLNTAKIADCWQGDCKIVGLDISDTQIKQAQQTNKRKNVEYGVQDVSAKLPFEDCQVDMITAVMALHWFDVEMFFAECKRVLKPGGVIAMVVQKLTLIETVPNDIEVGQKLGDLVVKVCDDIASVGYPHPALHGEFKNGYCDVKLPFEEQRIFRGDPSIYSRHETKAIEFLNCVETWSNIRYYQKETDGSIVKDFKKNFLSFASENIVQVTPWCLVMCRKP